MNAVSITLFMYEILTPSVNRTINLFVRLPRVNNSFIKFIYQGKKQHTSESSLAMIMLISFSCCLTRFLAVGKKKNTPSRCLSSVELAARKLKKKPSDELRLNCGNGLKELSGRTLVPPTGWEEMT